MNSSNRSFQAGYETLILAMLHDLGSELMGVYNGAWLLTERLREYKRLSKKTRAAADSLEQSIHSGARSKIHSLQVLLEPPAVKEVSFRGIVQEVIQSLRSNAKIEVNIDGGATDDILVRTHEEAFKEALRIVLHNGIQAVEQSGMMIWVSAAKSGDYLQVSVRDNGSGFKAAVLGKLGFDRIQSTWGGRGIGLWICGELVRRILQGSLQCRNIERNGAEVLIEIPLQRETEQPPVELPAPPTSTHTEKKAFGFRPLTPEAQRYFDRKFLPRLKSLRQKILKEALAVCVWGPGTVEHPVYQTRVELLNELRRLGHAAFFTEQLDARTTLGVVPQVPSSLRVEEFLHASAADLVIVIRCSPGSLAEFHDFAQFRTIAQNMLVAADEKDNFGYSDRGALLEHEHLYGKVIRYKHTGEILSRVLDVVGVLQCQKFLARQQGKDWRL